MAHRPLDRFARLLTVWLVAISALTGCGDEGSGGEASGDPPIFAAADPSRTCPAGYMGWDFATGGADAPPPPAIKVRSITCESPASAGSVEAEKALIKTRCDGFGSCTAAMACNKGLTVTWTCGKAEAEFSKTSGAIGFVELSCFVAADADGGIVETEERLEGKACVPKSCPSDTYRDANMQCVAGPKQTPEPFLFGPPAAVALQRTTANESVERLVGGTDYLFIGTIFSELHIGTEGIQVPDGRLAFWFADEYVRKDGKGAPVQGFRCTAAQAAVSNQNLIYEYEAAKLGPLDRIQHVLPISLDSRAAWVTARTSISPECVKSEFSERAKRDAARRAGVALADFERDYQLSRLRLHTSFDLEGRVILPQKTVDFTGLGPVCAAPNPPGFFYRAHPDDPSRSYVDWIGYYKQRELTAYDFPALVGVTNDNYRYNWEARGIYSATDLTNGVPFGTRASELATRVRMGNRFVRVNNPELTIKKFGNAVPSLNVDVGWYLAGSDNKSNPYVYGGAKADKIESFTDRKLRADVYIVPEGQRLFDAGSAMLIGGVLLKDGAVTGASNNGRVGIARAKLKRFFAEWADHDRFRVFTCLAAKGLSTVEGLPQQKDLPNVANAGVTYGAGLDDDGVGCVAADTVLVVTRDESRSPLDPASGTADFEGSRDEGSGDSNTQGSQGNGSEQGCASGSCSLDQRGDMAASGMFGNTIFDSSSSSSETQDEDGSGQVDLGGGSEIFGFQVLDSPDDETFEWADEADVGPSGLKFEHSIDWEAIEEAIDESLNGTNIEADSGRYGGRKGLGIAYGYKTRVNIGPIPGEVEIAVAAGVGLTLSFEIAFKPEEDYPCMVDEPPETGLPDKCYMVLEDKTTQNDARSECAKLGGILIEPRAAGEFDALRSIIDDDDGSDAGFWVGGQQAYQYVGASCASPQSLGEVNSCSRAAKLWYRWLSDDATFATATGAGQPAMEDGMGAFTESDLQLVSKLPAEGAVSYDRGTRRLTLTDPAVLQRGICEFAPAKSTRYLAFKGGVGVGVSAGLRMSFCTPSEDLGICLEGGVNFVSIELGFESGHEMHTIELYEGGTLKVGGAMTEVPWKMSLLSGYLQAVFHLQFFEIPVPIVEWAGFTIADEPLFERYTPVTSREP